MWTAEVTDNLYSQGRDEREPTRSPAMPVKAKGRSASDYLPPKLSLPALVKAARHCEGCDLYKHVREGTATGGDRRRR
ncbi:MAG: hypothetical protein AMXMBFR13_21750 [Phycisphaerae bacterium]